MSSLREICRICLCDIDNNNSTLKKEVTTKLLNILLPKLNLEQSDSVVMCSVCSRKLLAASEFKLTCTNAAIPQVDINLLSLSNLREMYSKRIGNNTVIVSEDEKVCRLCMKSRGNDFMSFKKMEVNLLQTFLPEVCLDNIEEFFVCRSCFDSVISHCRFLKNCLDMTEVKSIFSCTSNTVIKNEPLLESSVRTEEVTVKFEEQILNDYNIKPENIKREIEEIELICFKNEIIEDHVSRGDSFTYENDQNMLLGSQQQNDQIDINKCKTKQNSLPGSCQLVYKCHICQYGTRFRNRLKMHQLVHKDPSQVQMHKCDTCSFETKFKNRLKMHQLVHQGPPETKMHNCDICDFETKFKDSLKTHELTHKHPSLLHIHRCLDCEYQTKYMSHFKRHQLTHKDISEVQMYKCDICNYKTKFTDSLKKHKLTHKEPSLVQIYTCLDCEFETKYRSHIKRHQLIHKDSSEVQMHKCDLCAYETKFKNSLKKHQLKHRDASQVEMFKCDFCDHETKFKTALTRHVLIHKDPSEVQMHKCDVCDYETKFKYNLKNHQLIHTDPEQVQMYRCKNCTYKSKYKGDLKKHQSVHRTCSEVQL